MELTREQLKIQEQSFLSEKEERFDIPPFYFKTPKADIDLATAQVKEVINALKVINLLRFDRQGFDELTSKEKEINPKYMEVLKETNDVLKETNYFSKTFYGTLDFNDLASVEELAYDYLYEADLLFVKKQYHDACLSYDCAYRLLYQARESASEVSFIRALLSFAISKHFEKQYLESLEILIILRIVGCVNLFTYEYIMLNISFLKTNSPLGKVCIELLKTAPSIKDVNDNNFYALLIRNLDNILDKLFVNKNGHFIKRELLRPYLIKRFDYD